VLGKSCIAKEQILDRKCDCGKAPHYSQFPHEICKELSTEVLKTGGFYCFLAGFSFGLVQVVQGA
jgi:hypothetical protein